MLKKYTIWRVLYPFEKCALNQDLFKNPLTICITLIIFFSQKEKVSLEFGGQAKA